MAAVFSRSSKRRETLIHKSFEFWKHKDYKNGTTAWRCTKSVLFHCKARVTTRGEDIIAETNALHTHEGNRATALGRKAIAEMKNNMSQINSTPSSSQGALLSICWITYCWPSKAVYTQSGSPASSKENRCRRQWWKAITSSPSIRVVLIFQLN